MVETGLVLIQNAKIWSSGQPDRKWMVFDKSTGRIIDVGENEIPQDVTDRVKESIDAKDCRILPGLHESHIHVGLTGKARASLDLTNAASVDALKVRLKEYAEKNAEKAWILGAGWEQDKLGRYPTREDLDDVCKDRPVMVHRICQHIALVNSKALQIAGITKDTPIPEGGGIDKFPEDHPKAGQPTGILREDPAVSLVVKHLKFTREEKLSWIETGLQICMDNGCTAVHSNEEDTWNEYKWLAEQKKLPIRVFFADMNSDRSNPNAPGYAGEKVGDLLSCDRMKIFADGALGAATCALSENYKHHCHRGLLIHSQESLNTQVQKANASGFRLEIHVIGDRAAEAAIEALEGARVTPEKRPILTHCQILRKDLVDRMKKLGAIANIQPQFVTTDARWVGDILPDSLMPWAYAWKSLLEHGIVCAGGSDAPIESPEPLIGIYDAIYRPDGHRDPHNQQSFRPEESLSTNQALELYTTAGAYTTRREDDLGQLLPGYFADFIILENDCDPVSNSKLFLTAKVAQVWVAGIRKK